DGERSRQRSGRAARPMPRPSLSGTRPRTPAAAGLPHPGEALPRTGPRPTLGDAARRIRDRGFGRRLERRLDPQDGASCRKSRRNPRTASGTAMMNASMTGQEKEPGMTAPMQDMPGLNERLARHFVRRLRREAERNAVKEAVAAGFLREEYVDSGGRVLQVFHPGEELPATASAQQAAAMLSRRRRRLLEEAAHPVLGSGDLFVEEDEPELPPTASAARIRPDHAPPENMVPAT